MQRSSAFLEKLQTLIAHTLIPIMKDDWVLLRTLPSELDESYTLCSFVIISLYTSIPHSLGISSLKYWINTRTFIFTESYY